MSEYQLENGILTIAPGTTYIRSQEFSGWEEIRKVILPEGVGFMEEECFAGCENLEEVILPEGLINLGVAAFGECAKLKKIHLPESLRSIDSGALLFCESLKTIRLPGQLESIGEMAFQNSGLTEICVPESVREIGDCAFFSCELLQKAEVLGCDTVIGQDAFGCDYKLLEGYIAPGYPEKPDAAAQLLYSLLIFTCPEKHELGILNRAKQYVRENQQIVLERIVKSNNIAALRGILQASLLTDEMIQDGLTEVLKKNQTEMAALLLREKQGMVQDTEEFEL